jgi:hypothetical protein
VDEPPPYALDEFLAMRTYQEVSISPNEPGWYRSVSYVAPDRERDPTPFAPPPPSRG